MRIAEVVCLSMGLMLTGCGSGDISIDRSNGLESTAGNSLSYFGDAIYPLLIKDRTGFAGGCAASGCHLKGSASVSVQTFFQVNKSSSSDSANWAMARRSRVTTGTYATTNSMTLKAQKDNNHNSFSQWSTEEKANLDTWTALSQ